MKLCKYFLLNKDIMLLCWVAVRERSAWRWLKHQYPSLHSPQRSVLVTV